MSKQLSDPLRPSGRTWLLAAVCALGMSVNLAGAAQDELNNLFGDPQGAWRVVAEVLCSFPTRDGALYVLGATLLFVPLLAAARQPRVRHAGGRAAWVLAALFTAVMLMGRSFDAVGSAALVWGSPAHAARAALFALGWLVVAHAALCLLFGALDRWRDAQGAVRPSRATSDAPAAPGDSYIPGFFDSPGRGFRMPGIRVSCGCASGAAAGLRACRRAARFVGERHPFAGPVIVLALCWLPVLVGYAPALFMWDTNTQILQWFGLPNHISSSVRLLDPGVLLTQHHPPLHTALVGLCVQAGLAVAGSENAGIFLYAVMQWVLDIAAISWALCLAREVGAPQPARLAALAFIAVVPAYSNYSVLVTKDVLFSAALLVFAMELVYLVACVRALEQGDGRCAGPPPRGRGSAVPGFTVRHRVLLAVGALGMTLLRSGMIVAVGGGLLAACSVMVLGHPHAGDARTSASHHLRRSVGRAYMRYPIIILGVVLGVSLVLSRVVYPALGVTPASTRELLSIPMQQVARVMHDDPDAVGPDDYRAIARVLDARDLAELYSPSKSDPVKATFNERATSDDLAAFLRAWVHVFLRDPGCCLSATVANYYGYVYPARAMSWSYTSYFSRRVMANTETNLIYSDIASYFSFHQPDAPLVRVLDGLCSGYRLVFQRLPLTTLAMQTALYSWTLVLVTAYAVSRRMADMVVIIVPAWIVLLVALVGPCNATTYFRYAYPVALLAPFMVALLGAPRVVPVAAEAALHTVEIVPPAAEVAPCVTPAATSTVPPAAETVPRITPPVAAATSASRSRPNSSHPHGGAQ